MDKMDKMDKITWEHRAEAFFWCSSIMLCAPVFGALSYISVNCSLTNGKLHCGKVARSKGFDPATLGDFTMTRSARNAAAAAKPAKNGKPAGCSGARKRKAKAVPASIAKHQELAPAQPAPDAGHQQAYIARLCEMAGEIAVALKYASEVMKAEFRARGKKFGTGVRKGTKTGYGSAAAEYVHEVERFRQSVERDPRIKYPIANPYVFEWRCLELLARCADRRSIAIILETIPLGDVCN